MARYAKRVMTANGVDNIVTVMQCAVEDIELPIEEDGLNPDGPVDIMIRCVDEFAKRLNHLQFCSSSHVDLFIYLVSQQ